MNKDLYQKKWKKLLKSAKGFSYIPFVNFVLVAGSMATGEINEDSDFDVIIGVGKGRIFTVRQLTAGYFRFFRKARKNNDNKNQAKDKFCLNHFVTSDRYKLDPPYNDYWIYLYKRLIPIFGKKEYIENFFKKNNWIGDVSINFDYLLEKDNIVKKILEKILKGKFGNFIEKIFKKYQLRKIEKSIKKSKGYKPQIRINDNELRFHMDTKRIEKWIKNQKNE
jgi:predicted nucleotidyltransferase